MRVTSKTNNFYIIPTNNFNIIMPDKKYYEQFTTSTLIQKCRAREEMKQYWNLKDRKKLIMMLVCHDAILENRYNK